MVTTFSLNTFIQSWVSGAIFVHIEAFIMLFSHSKLMMNNEDRGKNSAIYRRCLSQSSG
jgi:hypothetical protein